MSKMSALSTLGLSIELLLRVIDIKYDCFSLLYFTIFSYPWCSARETPHHVIQLNPGEVGERRRLLTKGTGYSAFTPDLERRNG